MLRATSTTTLTGPAAPTSPVQIPRRQNSRDASLSTKYQHCHHGERSRYRQSIRRRAGPHSPDAIPPAVAALLAITSIPPPAPSRSLHRAKARKEQKLTIENIIEQSQESEKKLSLKLGRGSLDLLLSAPQEIYIDDDAVSEANSNVESASSTRAVSCDSTPSLSDSFTTETVSSVDTSSTLARWKRVQPTRKLLEPLSSPPGEKEDHPLSVSDTAVLTLDSRTFEKPNLAPKKTRTSLGPLKSAFKSNLTASLRALRQAALSFSALSFTSIPSDDFLTRSILTIDPQVPYTDERRPPPLYEEPTAELRRYLNPTTTARLERPGQVALSSCKRIYTASIQMQTYKVHRSRNAPQVTGRIPFSTVGPSQLDELSSQRSPSFEYAMPEPRQREMRENSDFIRIAVMEMAMRKSGKLDNHQPGRARWALPPRKVSSKPYEIGADGVPVRWLGLPS